MKSGKDGAELPKAAINTVSDKKIDRLSATAEKHNSPERLRAHHTGSWGKAETN